MDIPPSKAVVIFDGTCNLCNASVDFVLRRDLSGRFLFASNQSQAGAGILRRFGVDPASVGSVYLVEGGRLWSKSSAAARIARGLPFPWNLGYALRLLPRFARDGLYDWIARNRYRWFGKAPSCRLPTEAERARFLDPS